VLFADDTSVLITSNNLGELKTKLTHTLTYMSECFTANGLQLKTDKTNTMHFKLNFSSNSALQISYRETNIKQAVHMKFLGLDLNNNMIWKTGINKIIPELSIALYVMIYLLLKQLCILSHSDGVWYYLLGQLTIEEESSPNKKNIYIYIHIYMNYVRVTN
jgi:hypothetical protein